MAPQIDPALVDHPQLREFALKAAWVAKLEDAVGALEDLVVDLEIDDLDEDADGADDDDSTIDDDPLETALSVVMAAFEDTEQELEAQITAWLGHDPEHWSIFRLVVLDPWQEQPGQWRPETPGWVRTLGTNTILAHFLYDPYGRQRMVDLGEPDEPSK